MNLATKAPQFVRISSTCQLNRLGGELIRIANAGHPLEELYIIALPDGTELAFSKHEIILL